MNDEKIETVKINTNNIEKNLDNEHLNTSQQLQNNITTDNNLEIMDFDLDEENTTTKAIKDKNSFTVVYLRMKIFFIQPLLVDPVFHSVGIIGFR